MLLFAIIVTHGEGTEKEFDGGESTPLRAGDTITINVADTFCRYSRQAVVHPLAL